MLRSRALRQGELLGDSSELDKLILLIDERRSVRGHPQTPRCKNLKNSDAIREDPDATAKLANANPEDANSSLKIAKPNVGSKLPTPYDFDNLIWHIRTRESSQPSLQSFLAGSTAGPTGSDAQQSQKVELFEETRCKYEFGGRSISDLTIVVSSDEPLRSIHQVRLS